MKLFNVFSTILVCFLSFGLLSCDKDDDKDGYQPTYENGKPSSVLAVDGKKVFFHYDGNKISQIKEEKSTSINFSYQDALLTSVSVSSPDRNILDGRISIEFKQDGSQIKISSLTDQNSLKLIQEMTLDENGIPIELTDLGYYMKNGDQWSKFSDGNYYAKFTIDATTKNILNQSIYLLSTSELISTTNYEYDTALGIISKIDMPLWFNVYWVNLERTVNRDLYSKLFLCYSNNVIKETTTSSILTDSFVKTYAFTYNRENYPKSMEVDYSDTNKISIMY